MKEINIASKIIEKRKEKGITQEDLATYVGVSKASVSKWETGQSYPDITILPILAMYFDISVDELIGYSPQMTTESIAKVYEQLMNRFATNDYEDAMKACDEVGRKYYNCYELQFHLAVLYTNYAITAPTQELREEMLNYSIEVVRRIKVESDDPLLIQNANELEATANLLLNKPIEVVDLLEDSITNLQSTEVILSSAYMMLGKQDKAIETLQFSCFSHVLNLIQDLQNYIMLFVSDQVRFEEIKERILQVAKSFKIDKLNTNSMATAYLTIAGGYMQQGKTDEALKMLNEYVAVCKLFEYPVTLKGDEFFDKIEHKFDQLKLMKIAPRAEKNIKDSIIAAVEDNPAFIPLHENKEFIKIVKELKKL